MKTKVKNTKKRPKAGQIAGLAPATGSCGTAKAMGDTVIFKGKVFDIFQFGKLVETVETWKEVLDFTDKQPKQTTEQALKGYDYLRANSKRLKREEEKYE